MPNVVIGPDGKPTQQSLDALYAFLGKNYGENAHVSTTYYQTTNYKDRSSTRRISPNITPATDCSETIVRLSRTLLLQFNLQRNSSKMTMN